MVFAAVFAIVVGLGMIVQWALSYVSKQIPELATEPIRIGFHIAGEMEPALMLLPVGLACSARALGPRPCTCWPPAC